MDYYLDVLPIVALQFLLGLRSRNVLLPVGIGLGVWTVSMVGLSWSYNYVLPYAYVAMDFLSETGGMKVGRALPATLDVVALAAFGAITVVAYSLFVVRRDRG